MKIKGTQELEINVSISELIKALITHLRLKYDIPEEAYMREGDPNIWTDYEFYGHNKDYKQEIWDRDKKYSLRERVRVFKLIQELEKEL